MPIGGNFRSEQNHSEHRFSDRSVIVTGGGMGIGRATAERFAAEGASVAIFDVARAAADEVVAGIAKARGDAVAIEVDVTSSASVHAGVTKAVAKFGPTNVLINNVGGSHAPAGVEIEESEWDRVIALNLKSCLLVCQAVWPHMVDNAGGVILNAASLAGQWPLPGLIAYCSAKAGIRMLTKMLGQQGAAVGIRVNCVSPGYINTPALEGFTATQPDPDAFAAESGKIAALGRLGRPEEIADMYAYLASDGAGWMTGSEVTIDGGASLVAGERLGLG